MTTENENITKIRQLLALYYDGTATNAQTEEIAQLFASTSRLPDDLVTEQRMFNTLKNAVHEAIDIPSDLSHRIEQAITANRSRTIRILWIRAISIAAAIAIICTIGLHISLPTTLHIPTIDAPHDILMSLHTTDSVTATVQSVEPIAKTIPQKRNIPLKTKLDKNISTKNTENQVIVVTDSIEASFYAEQSLQLLALNLSHAETACDHTDQTIYEINHTLTELLK